MCSSNKRKLPAVGPTRPRQDGDPDLLERNSQDWSKSERMILPFVSMLVWKWAYYAPNTYKDDSWMTGEIWFEQKISDTVGQIPAPPSTMIIPLFIGL